LIAELAYREAVAAQDRVRAVRRAITLPLRLLAAVELGGAVIVLVIGRFHLLAYFAPAFLNVLVVSAWWYRRYATTHGLLLPARPWVLILAATLAAGASMSRLGVALDKPWISDFGPLPGVRRRDGSHRRLASAPPARADRDRDGDRHGHGLPRSRRRSRYCPAAGGLQRSPPQRLRRPLRAEGCLVTEHPIHDLDDDVHQRVRLGILAALTGLARADFAHLKRELALTDGNLGRHLEVLGAAGFVKLTRDTAKSRPRTWVSITAKGKKALRKELDALRKIMSQVEDAEAGAASNEPFAPTRQS